MILTKESKLSYNNKYITVDDKPWFPVMGEMHYSRYKKKLWEDELYKMKSGGLDIVSCYTIWIHHEEIEGEFDFEGDKDLHAFISMIKDSGLYCILRIGPWAHGEARNGGFPDWLLEKEKDSLLKTRFDDDEYLKYVRRFYEKVYEQVDGFLLKDNGPIIGIQIENEYGHCGGYGGEVGEKHMMTLKNMAKEIGFDVPLYTATGWGGAVTGGMLPVMGGYCEAPWDQRLTEIEPSGNYVFTKERNDHNIGSDHGIGFGITFDMDKFPYLTAELGGGLQITDHRRPVAIGSDIGAMSMVKLGSGCNLLGYYMYHGGTNPYGIKTTLMESRATGYLNDLPVMSYDFNAPLKEYGQITDTYREIKLLSMFVHDFNDEICNMPYVEQKENTIDPANLDSLRTAVRCMDITFEGQKLKSGFLFVNNYQRHYVMKNHKDVTLKAFDENGDLIVSFPNKQNIMDENFFFYPFNMKIGEKAIIKTASVTPLCILHGSAENGKDAYVFYINSALAPQIDIEGDLDGNKIILITREDALCAQKLVIDGKEYLAFSDDNIVETKTGYDILINIFDDIEEEQKARFYVWPKLPKTPARFHEATDILADSNDVLENSDIIGSDVFTEYVYDFVIKNEMTTRFELICDLGSEIDDLKESVEIQDENRKCYKINVDNIDKNADEVFLFITYAANHGGLYKDGRMIADSFYSGQEWEVGLKRFIDFRKENNFEAKIALTPLYKDAPKYLEYWPYMEDGKACRIESVSAKILYREHII